MLNCRLSELNWNRSFLVISGEDKSYPLHHLALVVEQAADEGELIHSELLQYTKIHIRHSRINQDICCVTVSAAEQADYRALQKAVITSKLDAIR